MATTEPGAARQFPAGRLSDFEGAGDPGDQDSNFLKGLLPPRLTPRNRPAPAPAGPDAGQAPAAAATALAGPQAPESGTVEIDQTEQGSAESTGPATRTGASIEHIGEGIRTTRSPRKRSPRPAPAETPDEALGEEEVDAAGSRLRASNVHIPASFMPRLAKARGGRRLSNGEWVIVALEATHGQLGELIRPQPTGGSLFAPRATRAARTYDGPLTPFNIRLREADYAVIDHLVEQFGASSRGHLITVAFDAFLPTA